MIRKEEEYFYTHAAYDVVVWAYENGLVDKKTPDRGIINW